MLYTPKIIKEGAHSDMFKVRDLRNRFVHNDYSIATPTDILSRRMYSSGIRIEAFLSTNMIIW
jgi:hypothetical protein